MIKWVSTPVVHTDKVVLSSVRKQIQADMLHREAEVSSGRRSYHGVSWLRRKDTNAVLACGDQLLDVIRHPRPEVQTTSQISGLSYT